MVPHRCGDSPMQPSRHWHNEKRLPNGVNNFWISGPYVCIDTVVQQPLFGKHSVFVMRSSVKAASVSLSLTNSGIAIGDFRNKSWTLSSACPFSCIYFFTHHHTNGAFCLYYLLFYVCDWLMRTHQPALYTQALPIFLIWHWETYIVHFTLCSWKGRWVDGWRK